MLLIKCCLERWPHCQTPQMSHTVISSSVIGGVGAGQGVEGILSSSEVTLALGEGLRMDRC